MAAVEEFLAYISPPDERAKVMITDCALPLLSKQFIAYGIVSDPKYIYYSHLYQSPPSKQ